MIPRQDMKCLYQNYTFTEAMDFIKKHNHTRFPLCNKDKDHIIGMLHIRDLLEYEGDENDKDILTKLARKILFVPENKSISEILHQMMLRHVHLAIVVDEYGGTAGLLSMEDILEELVGDIMDEHDDITDEPIKKLTTKSANLTAWCWSKTLSTAWGCRNANTRKAPWAVMFSDCSDGCRKWATKWKTSIVNMR